MNAHESLIGARCTCPDGGISGSCPAHSALAFQRLSEVVHATIDEKPRNECAKCASSDLNVVFHKQGCSNEGCSCATCAYGSHAKEHREHLHVFCRRCSFDWVAPTMEQLQALAETTS